MWGAKSVMIRSQTTKTHPISASHSLRRVDAEHRVNYKRCAEMNASHEPPTVRLDIWLDVACLYRTRSEAQKACQGGKVEVNGQSCKPHRQLRVGDELRLSRPFGQKTDAHRARPRRSAHAESGGAAALSGHQPAACPKKKRKCAGSNGCTARACSARTRRTSASAGRMRKLKGR